MIGCLNQINDAGGFSSVHNSLCHHAPGCDEDVSEHVAVPGSNGGLMTCMNVCSRCSKKIQATHRNAIVSPVKH